MSNNTAIAIIAVAFCALIGTLFVVVDARDTCPEKTTIELAPGEW